MQSRKNCSSPNEYQTTADVNSESLQYISPACPHILPGCHNTNVISYTVQFPNIEKIDIDVYFSILTLISHKERIDIYFNSDQKHCFSEKENFC
jgi:hypothetical protein